MEVSYLHKELILLNVHRHSRNRNGRPSISIQSPEIKKGRGKKGERKKRRSISISRVAESIVQSCSGRVKIDEIQRANTSVRTRGKASETRSSNETKRNETPSNTKIRRIKKENERSSANKARKRNDGPINFSFFRWKGNIDDNACRGDERDACRRREMRRTKARHTCIPDTCTIQLGNEVAVMRARTKSWSTQ